MEAIEHPPVEIRLSTFRVSFKFASFLKHPFIKQVTGARRIGSPISAKIAFNGEEEGAIVMQRSDDRRGKSERLELFALNTDSDIIAVERGSLDYPGVSFRNDGPERR